MIAGPSLQTIDHALRGGAIVLLLLIAALLLRDHARARAARLGWAFAVGVAAYAVCSSPEFALDAKPWHAPILVLCFGNSLVFWLFARALFDDAFTHRWWHLAAWVALASIGLVQIFVLSKSPLAQIVGIGLTLASLSFAALAVGQTLAGWRTDLIEGRRHLRVFVVGGVAGYVVLIAAVELALRGGPTPALASVANATGLVAMSAVIAWPLLRVGGDDLFPAPLALPRNSLAASKPPSDGGGEAPSPEPIKALERLMASDRVYREENLTIGRLALKLGIPEYRLRRLINQGLGYRNFNAFVNHYRIEEAKAALSDLTQTEVPVLTIAMDCGFQSLGPFNRAFKAETGLTPTEYRRAKLVPRVPVTPCPS